MLPRCKVIFVAENVDGSIASLKPIERHPSFVATFVTAMPLKSVGALTSFAPDTLKEEVNALDPAWSGLRIGIPRALVIAPSTRNSYSVPSTSCAAAGVTVTTFDVAFESSATEVRVMAFADPFGNILILPVVIVAACIASLKATVIFAFGAIAMPGAGFIDSTNGGMNAPLLPKFCVPMALKFANAVPCVVKRSS